MDAYNTQICMELRSSHFCFGFINHKTSEKKVVDEVSLGSSPDEQKEALTKAFDNTSLFKENYKEYTFAISNQRSTLVPTPVFDVSKAEDIYTLNFARKEGSVDYNRVPEMNLSVIYEMDDFVKRKLVMKAPRTRIFHQTSVLLKAISDDNVFKTKAYLQINDGFFQLFITDKTKLIFYNAFDYQSENDIIYHLLFVLEQKELSTEKIVLRLTGVDIDHKLVGLLQKYFQQPVELPEKLNSHFSLFSQFLCA